MVAARAPDEIALMTSRTVVPVMLALRVRRPLNMLDAEALALALLTEAPVLVTTEAPLLRSGADDLGVSYQLIS